MSGGTEGVLSPHCAVFARRASEGTLPAPEKRLAIGIAFTRDFLAEDIGRQAQIEATAAAARLAMTDAAIESPADIHFVQVKCPLLSPTMMESARERGVVKAITDTYQ
jgi:cyanuric acid amidohydrolase